MRTYNENPPVAPRMLSPVSTISSAAARSFSGRKILVMGLGRFGGGVGVTRWLAQQGATVTVTDSAPADTLTESAAQLADLKVTLRFGLHQPRDLDGIELVIVNPAVKKEGSEFFREILRRNIPWTTELNLFCERCPAPVLAVTGSFGKSTTCAMLAAALDAAKTSILVRRVHLGGNIGRSLLSELLDIDSADMVVLEMSNAQLEDIPHINWRPHLAVFTNLRPHHLDRYSSPDDYFHAKLNLIRRGAALGKVLVGECTPRAAQLLNEVARRAGVSVIQLPVETNLQLVIPGAHNRLNAACVMAICRELGCDESLVKSALESFPGLEHRLEFVREVGGVRYFNDSKSTAPTATIMALRALTESSVSPGRILCIVGGQRKPTELCECARELVRSCKAVICMGESGPDFAAALRQAAPAEAGPTVTAVADLMQAVTSAKRLAGAGDVILLSPGAPSFDQYSNFALRGQRFVNLVKGLT